MGRAMTISLFSAYSLLAWFIYDQRRAIAGFNGSSQVYLAALNISVLVGTVVSLSLLVYIGISLSWYVPLLLFLWGIVAAASLSNVAERLLGRGLPELLGFLGWPLSALWTYSLIQA